MYEQQAGLPTVVVLTALNLELRAVRALLADCVEEEHSTGTIFQVGTVPGASCRVALAVAGEGSIPAAVITTHAHELFDPEAVLFVGIAGGLKEDIALGDVVVATKVYAYQGGKVEQDGTFSARPQAFAAPHRLAQRAQHLPDTWHRGAAGAPAVHFKPVAAGDVVLNSRKAPLAQQLRDHYSDAAAIEMESAGSSHAGHIGGLEVLTIRGISDHADGAKQVAEAQDSQRVAADHAARYALALVAALKFPAAGARAPRRTAAPVGPTHTMNVEASSGGTAYAVQDGHLFVTAGPDRPRWRRLSAPRGLVRRPEFTQLLGAGPVLELHLVNASEDDALEYRELNELPRLLSYTGREYLPVGAEAKVVGETVLCYAVDDRSMGLFVHRSGDRGAWDELPYVRFGSDADMDDLRDRANGMLERLLGIDMIAPSAFVPVLGVEQPAPGESPLFTSATEAVTFGQLQSDSYCVADELVARLVHQLRNR
ncbi:hypothetical protein ACIA8O_01915 [Kitasatospora sp. NPDC051853]|uniref:5'-methylthioadenosine/S-adenosylhomocysteine nucleosidase family protein n=1 Tax=Kitasatospora sp. NPDC051853 TaxID=3364058 RepID=UPI0037997CFB